MHQKKNEFRVEMKMYVLKSFVCFSIIILLFGYLYILNESVTHPLLKDIKNNSVLETEKSVNENKILMS